ncbi:DGQHR domain-containing protein [Pseudomonas putida]|uniref:DGQHR domain-containing protein n=1 Tax=Pseudomonas putida TaxID=303 RepID=UPI003F4AE6ED
MNSVSVKYLQIAQPIGNFYCVVMSAKDLYNISYSDVRRLENEQTDSGIDSYLGIQRELAPSRVKKIHEYINSVDATFPNSIIVAIDEKFLTLNKDSLSITYSDYQKGKVAKILDGQHRLAGFENSDFCFSSIDGVRKDFELLVTIFVEADLHTQAQVFTMVNQNQTKVNRSLVYDLESLALARSPTKSAHQIAVVLNSNPKSPLYHRIKRLGLKTNGIDSEMITQAAFVDNLVKLITKRPSVDRDILLGRKKNFLGLRQSSLPDLEPDDFYRLPFRKSFALEDDSAIAANLYNFFSAVAVRWPNSWDHKSKASVLNKTIGFIALIRTLRDVYNSLIDNRGKKYGTIFPEDDYLTILKSIKIRDDFFFTFEPSSKTSGIIYKSLKR